MSQFGMMPPFFPMMMYPEHSYAPRQQTPDIIVPARVNKAMDFLQFLAQKRRKGAAVGEHQIEVLEPDVLTDEETATQDSALQMLARYFDGKLQPDEWENVRFQALKKRAKEGTLDAPLGGQIMPCPNCAGRNPKCALCFGRGELLIQPAPDIDDEGYDDDGDEED